MKLVSFTTTNSNGNMRSGIETAAGIADTRHVAAVAGLGEDTRGRLDSTRAVLALPQADLRTLEQAARESAPQLEDRTALHDPTAVHLGPPVPDPQKIICLGLNYRDHAQEAGLTPPSTPIFFVKFANSLIGPTDQIVPPQHREGRL